MPTTTMKKVKSILISQPYPENKSPYFSMADKYDVEIDFQPFISLEGVTTKEFRKQRIALDKFPAVIFNSRNAMDHYFRIGEELRYTISQETKYFCMSEAIALYLQKHIQYRKRKVFYGNGTFKDFTTLLKKHKSTGQFLYPCSDTRKPLIPNHLEEQGYDFKEVVLYRTVNADLSEVPVEDYDMMVFFSPFGLKSLFENYPDYKQGDTRIAAFGTTTCAMVEELGLRLDVKAPVPESRSMSLAIEKYLKTL